MLKFAEACQKDGKTFAIGLGGAARLGRYAPASLFEAFGAEAGRRQGRHHGQVGRGAPGAGICPGLVKFLPADAVSYDDASNNRALISGKSALIWNPPSAWAVAKRDAPTVAADCWTFPAPTGPKGRFVPLGAFSWGVWNFAPNKPAAKELIEFLMQREQVEARGNASLGYDLPPYASMTDFKIWEEVEPPKGTVFNYPIRQSHNQQNSIASGARPRRRSRCRSTTAGPADDAGHAAGWPVDPAGEGLGAGRTGRLRARDG